MVKSRDGALNKSIAGLNVQFNESLWLLPCPRFDLQHQHKQTKTPRKNATFLGLERKIRPPAHSPVWGLGSAWEVFQNVKHLGEIGTDLSARDEEQDFIPDGKV